MPQGTSSGRPFVLCADDYGLSPGVSRGILMLIRMGRVSATGCMVTMPQWPALAPALAEI
ncbi:MAG: ChbG/HpnK family deacetylase, partial [Alphaproteobacteria bacterium]|nr:ChbG/HpnK family deacetylase [Alphaproteobacteria bacterium]